MDSSRYKTQRKSSHGILRLLQIMFILRDILKVNYLDINTVGFPFFHFTFIAQFVHTAWLLRLGDIIVPTGLVIIICTDDWTEEDIKPTVKDR